MLVVEARARRAVVGEWHLTRALREDHVLVNALLVLDDGHAVHLVLLPIHQGLGLGPLLERPVLPLAIVGHPDAEAVAHALQELAHVSSAALCIAWIMLHTVPVRDIVRPHAVVYDALQFLLLPLVVLNKLRQELREVEPQEIVRCHRPMSRIRSVRRRERLALFETLDELLSEHLVGPLIDIQGAEAFAGARCRELPVIIAARPFAWIDQVTPSPA
mmetsp:Transcript_111174/g.319436  ORF Transcript_111174/g.319436 Transcript_111174/m.319436 type:complete len:217 (-) Transcript_111174:6714-7364(-)